jgi:hypothetical protein
MATAIHAAAGETKRADPDIILIANRETAPSIERPPPMPGLRSLVRGEFDVELVDCQHPDRG